MPQIESKVFPSFANRAIAQKKAMAELKRLREIEICAEKLYNETILGYLPDPLNLQKLENLFDLSVNSDQLKINV
jgi:hypothetical protein